MLRQFTERTARERNCSNELVRAILSDFLLKLHECVVKEGVHRAIVRTYDEVSDRAAWHLMGTLYKAAEDGEPGEILVGLQLMDHTMERFNMSILQQWAYELKQQRDNEE